MTDEEMRQADWTDKIDPEEVLIVNSSWGIKTRGTNPEYIVDFLNLSPTSDALNIKYRGTSQSELEFTRKYLDQINNPKEMAVLAVIIKMALSKKRSIIFLYTAIDKANGHFRSVGYVLEQKYNLKLIDYDELMMVDPKNLARQRAGKPFKPPKEITEKKRIVAISAADKVIESVARIDPQIHHKVHNELHGAIIQDRKKIKKMKKKILKQEKKKVKYLYGKKIGKNGWTK